MEMDLKTKTGKRGDDHIVALRRERWGECIRAWMQSPPALPRGPRLHAAYGNYLFF